MRDHYLLFPADEGADVVVEKVRDDQQVDDLRGHLDPPVVKDAEVMHEREHNPKGQGKQSMERGKSNEVSKRFAHHSPALEHPQLRKQRKESQHLVHAAEHPSGKVLVLVTAEEEPPEGHHRNYDGEEDPASLDRIRIEHFTKQGCAKVILIYLIRTPVFYEQCNRGHAQSRID